MNYKLTGFFLTSQRFVEYLKRLTVAPGRDDARAFVTLIASTRSAVNWRCVAIVSARTYNSLGDDMVSPSIGKYGASDSRFYQILEGDGSRQFCTML